MTSTTSKLLYAGGIIVGVVVLDTLVHKATTPSSSSPYQSPVLGGGAQAQPAVTVTFTGGPAGSIPDPEGGNLANLTTILANSGTAAATVTLSIAVVPATGSTYTGGKWYAYPGQPGNSTSTGQPQVTVAVAAGSQVSILWGSTWSGNPGTYQNIATVGVSGMPSQTFTDNQTFTIVAQAPASTPAAAALGFSGGPSGTITGTVGATQQLGPLTTTLQNTGQTSGTFTVSVAINGPAPGTWYSTYGLASGANGVATITVTLAGGQSVAIPWYTAWTFEAANAGTYSNVATVSW